MPSILARNLLLLSLIPILSLQAQHHAQWFISPVPFGLQINSASVGDGTFIVAASYRKGVHQEMLIFRTDACGNWLWAKKWNSPVAPHGRLNNLKVFGNEVFIFSCLNPLFPDSAGVITKLDIQGNHLWSKSYSTGDSEFWFHLDINYKGDLLLFGHNNSHVHFDNQIAKLNHLGNLIWSYSYIESPDWGIGTATKDGGFLKLSGKTIYKIKSDGSPAWIYDYKHLGFPNNVAPLEVEDGFLIPVNRNRSTFGMSLMKINHQGEIIWASKVSRDGYPRNIARDEEGNIFLFGSKSSGKNWVIKFTSQGKILTARQTNGGEDNGFSYYNGHLNIFQRAYVSGNYGIRYTKLPQAMPDSGVCLPSKIDTSRFVANEAERTTSSLTIAPLAYPLSVDTLAVNLSSWTPSSQLLCENLNAIPDSVNLGPDTAFCPGGSIKLGANNGVLGEYLWSTGAKSRTITVKTPGVYWLEVNAGCGQKIMRDSISVGEYELDNLDFTLEGQPSVLDTVIIGLKTNGFLRAEWYVNDTLKGASENLKWRFSKPGVTYVKACYTNTNFCTTCDSLRIYVPEEKLHLPDAFTPNGDGLNDFFGPDESAVYNYTLTVFTRNGKEIITLENEPWNGQRKGRILPQGVYLYRLKFQFFKGDRQRILNGHITLVP